MKGMKSYIGSIVFSMFILLCACEKDELTLYDDQAAVNFNKSEMQYSFMNNLDADKDTVSIALGLMGFTADYDREVNVEIISDTITTASSEQYRVLGGTVKANEYDGFLYVEVLKTPELDTSSVAVHIRLIDSRDLKAGSIEKNQMKLEWTSQIIQPKNWSRLRAFFCLQYSTEVYKTMIRATGITDWSGALITIPYSQMVVYGTQFGDYIREYNKQHPGDPLKHDDGPYKGRAITPLY